MQKCGNGSVLNLRTASDVPFAHRLSVILQALSDDVRSSDLITDAQRLLDSVTSVPIERALKETWPACQVEVPLTDVYVPTGMFGVRHTSRPYNDSEAQP